MVGSGKIKSTQLELVFFTLGGEVAMQTGLGIKETDRLQLRLDFSLRQLFVDPPPTLGPLDMLCRVRS